MSDVLRGTFAAKRQQLVDHARRVDAGLAEVRRSASERQERERKAEAERADFVRCYELLARETNVVCHEIVLSRSGDEWSLAFAYLANYLLAQLSKARLSGNPEVKNALVWDLDRLGDAVLKSFGDRRMIIDPWIRAIGNLGSATEPVADRRPHPHADSLGRIICVLRDTGPTLALRELYAPSDSAVHIIRPA